MSGYLARLAARAGGAPAAAGPRLPSRFEPAGNDGSTDAATAASVASPQVAPANAETSAGARVGEAHPDTPATESARAEGDRAAAPATDVADPRPEATGTDAGIPAAAPAPPDGEALGTGSGHAAAPPPAAPVRTAAAPRVEAEPPRRAASATAVTSVGATARDEASVPSSEPDVVHVTIGRVDVRATVTAPASPARSPRPSRDGERSLHDYLAGRPR